MVSRIRPKDIKPVLPLEVSYLGIAAERKQNIVKAMGLEVFFDKLLSLKYQNNNRRQKAGTLVSVKTCFSNQTLFVPRNNVCAKPFCFVFLEKKLNATGLR